jgi:hypothetical protein
VTGASSDVMAVGTSITVDINEVIIRLVGQR